MTLNVTFDQVDDFAVLFEDANNVIDLDFNQVDDFAVLFEDANNVIALDIGSFQYVAIPPILEERTATPSAETQILTPSEGVQGFSKVTVGPIPQNYGLITYNGSIITVT